MLCVVKMPQQRCDGATMDADLLAMIRAIEKRLAVLERALLPQSLDDQLEPPHDHSDTAGPNKAVEGA